MNSTFSFPLLTRRLVGMVFLCLSVGNPFQFLGASVGSSSAVVSLVGAQELLPTHFPTSPPAPSPAPTEVETMEADICVNLNDECSRQDGSEPCCTGLVCRKKYRPTVNGWSRKPKCLSCSAVRAQCRTNQDCCSLKCKPVSGSPGIRKCRA